MFICIYLCVYECGCPQRPEQNARALGARVIGSCELPDTIL